MHPPCYQTTNHHLKIKQIFAIGIFCLVLGACTNNQQQTTDPNHLSGISKSEPLEKTTLRSPKDSLQYGRESAAYRHLTRLWQIRQINGQPIQRTVILDLGQIMQGVGVLTLYPSSNHTEINIGCTPINLYFDIQNISTGTLHTKEIQRTLTACSDEFEDMMIDILADINYIEYTTNENQESSDASITIIAYQDKILLTPITP